MRSSVVPNKALRTKELLLLLLRAGEPEVARLASSSTVTKVCKIASSACSNEIIRAVRSCNAACGQVHTFRVGLPGHDATLSSIRGPITTLLLQGTAVALSLLLKQLSHVPVHATFAINSSGVPAPARRRRPARYSRVLEGSSSVYGVPHIRRA